VTQFKYKFTDHKNHVRYEGTDLRQLTLSILALYTITDDDLVDLGDYVQAQWKKLARETDTIQAPSNSWRQTDYRQQYLDGIKYWENRNNSMVFRLIGAQANAVEHGWAPPTSSAWADGIGQYDGQVHDLRPWLLTSGHPSVKMAGMNKADIDKVDPEDLGKKKSRSGANLYRILKFDTPALSEVIDQTATHMLAMENAKAVTDQQAAMSERESKRFLKRKQRELTHTARSLIDKDKDGNITFKPLDFSELAPAPDTYGEHVKWVYHQSYMNADNKPFANMTQALRHVMHKAKFTVFRTITDSEKQKSRKLFYSKGIKPAKLMSEADSPLVNIVRQSIINLLSGKTVDGRDKDGSGS
jgi:hypothetical protein